MSERRLRVAVLFGGRSAEHEISCISARAVIDALDPAVFDVVPIGITREGRWHVLAAAPRLPEETGRLPEVRDDAGPAVELAGEGSRQLVVADGRREAIDVVFPVLHGTLGEDGSIQGLLEVAGLPYVGAGVLGSALGIDKAVQKVLFAAAGLRVVPWEPVREPEWRDDAGAVAARVAALKYPLFAKPATLGSSIGISKVHGPEDLARAMDEAFRYARKAIVEHAIEGAREVECSVLGNDDPVASVPGEIVPEGHEFYDYAAKYLDENGAELKIPAPIPDDVREQVQRAAVVAFQAVECSGLARVDFFLRDGVLWINEINTIPGFTSISMYPKLWEASGLPYERLVERLLQLARERSAAEKAKSVQVRELRADV